MSDVADGIFETNKTKTNVQESLKAAEERESGRVNCFDENAINQP